MKGPADLVVERIEQLKMERHGVLIVALDGNSGAGKTTIARQIEERIAAVNVSCDDFFVGGSNEFWSSKSTQQKIDSPIDWRRIRNEVLEPLRNGEPAWWHPFNWNSFQGLSATVITAEPKPVVILDGAFSSRAELQDCLDLTVLVRVPKELRVARIVKREGAEYSDDWHATWQEAMDYYFDRMRPPESFDLIVSGE